MRPARWRARVGSGACVTVGCARATRVDVRLAGMSVALGRMHSLVRGGLVVSVLLAITTPAGPEHVVRDPAACAAWQRQYANGCVVPAGKLAHHDDAAGYDARRVLTAGCDAITRRAASACSSGRP